MLQGGMLRKIILYSSIGMLGNVLVSAISLLRDGS